MPTEALTIGQLLDYLAPGLTEPSWPPDMFALVVALSQKSGAYTRVVESWPPVGTSDWGNEARAIGKEWRASITTGSPWPDKVATWWSLVLDQKSHPVSELRGTEPLWHALVRLGAVADEAS